ncbi:nicotinate-nucleotide--dimethylbenzimidazole phosphoribosyltransferase [Rudanella paleaurantiibacter]|uniref:Nicotinate-nucleotide--dimethylbenzimidazole phosphoribosyltransferase n=1 Tax=Rudanella paleaurantiibacter TaxID=2614655 RepID=A0A7J5TY08_9BACT|nr:nicotinate-nucleotide--dimethylbenzimidazole phosphoribosyltransferase [Rudanella paleaurantiibacter]KAB7730029.1 nicotinate-nucleotide--dimethylbenzimidazole phosphoribosyltransferase [Rudanella paleaurantiibacter]
MPITPVNRTRQAEFQQLIDQKTKPLGALGQLERLALQLALIQQSPTPTLTHPHLLVFAGDHGLTAEGVSAYPSAVTYQMVHNFLNGGAAVNVFCRANGLQLVVCDVGVNGSFTENAPGFVKYKVAPGTRNMRYEPAMTLDECEAAMDAGRILVDGLVYRDCTVVGFGEMGIGNTSSASLLMQRLTGLPLDQCVGRGTGLNDTALAHKLQVLQAVSDRHAEAGHTPVELLATLGGFEIAAIVGGMLRAAENQMVILVDGFIATAALLVAQAIDPAVVDYCVFCHESNEAGHHFMLGHLNAEPLLSLGMRLGEGSGCALAYPLLKSAAAMLSDMASFASAGVSEKE